MNSATVSTARGAVHERNTSGTHVYAVAGAFTQARISTSTLGMPGPSGLSSSSGHMPAQLPEEKPASLPAFPKDAWPDMLKILKTRKREEKINFIFERIGKNHYFSLDGLAEVGLNPATLVHENTGYSLLHQAIAKKNTAMIGDCLKVKGLELNAKCIDGYTPLYIAAWAGDVESVKHLLAMPNIDVNIGCGKWDPVSITIFDTRMISQRFQEMTALQIAIQEHHNEVATLILDSKNCDFNKKDAAGFNSLCTAALFSNEVMVEELLKIRTIEVNCVHPKLGLTALIMAVRIKNADIVDLLLTHKDIDVNQENYLGMTALDIAKSQNQQRIVNALVNKVAKDNGSILSA